MGSPGAEGAIRETVAALKTVFHNRNLRFLNLAYPVSAIGDWAYATAITVWIFGVAGASGVAIFGAARLSIMAIVAPFAATLADKFDRKKTMVLSDLVRVFLVAIAAFAISVEVPPLVVFALVGLTSVAALPFRPAQAALVPSLVNEPIELTAANGTTNTLESVAFFVGPAVAGLLLTVTTVPIVLAVNVLTFLWSMSMVIRIRVPAKARADELASVGGGQSTDAPASTDLVEANGAKPGFLAESAAGFRFIWGHSDLRMVTAMYAAQTVVAGASLVFGILLAVEYGLGPEGVGYLDSALGVGAILGGLMAISRGSKQRLAQDFGWGVVFWALPLVLIAGFPQVAVGFLAMAIVGGANPVVDINASTILQRLTPDEVMGRVFGALESLLIAGMAVGALVMPVLVHVFGLRWALGILGAGIVLSVLPTAGKLRRLDETLVPPEGLDLLRQNSLFAPLPRPTLEAVAHQLQAIRFDTDEVVVTQGETGHEFYLIENGQVAVVMDGRRLATLGRGDFFGEIALLRDVPRTATVTTLEPTVVLTLGREGFLAAMTGSDDALLAADDVVSRRQPGM